MKAKNLFKVMLAYSAIAIGTFVAVFNIKPDFAVAFAWTLGTPICFLGFVLVTSKAFKMNAKKELRELHGFVMLNPGAEKDAKKSH